MFFEGAQQFWASILRGWAGGKQRRGGREVATASEKLSREASE